MPKYILSWDTGFGSKDHAVIDATDLDTARMAAYECWREQAENNADYDAEPYSPERAEELEIEEPALSMTEEA